MSKCFLILILLMSLSGCGSEDDSSHFYKEIPHGLSVSHHYDTKNLACECSYHEGILDGLCFNYSKDGKLKSIWLHDYSDYSDKGVVLVSGPHSLPIFEVSKTGEVTIDIRQEYKDEIDEVRMAWDAFKRQISR